MEKYFTMDARYNIISPNNKGVGFDWFSWVGVDANSDLYRKDEGYIVMIQAYIRVSEIIAEQLRNNVGAYENVGITNVFMLNISHAVELLIKRIGINLNIKMNNTHNLKRMIDNLNSCDDFDNKVKEYIQDDKYIGAIEFLTNNYQLFRYNENTKGVIHNTYYICLGDWLSLVQNFYKIYVDILYNKSKEMGVT